MNRDRNEFKVGLTVAVVLALFVVVLLFVGQWDRMFVRTKCLTVRFKHQDGIQGLRKKDPVRVGGVSVGTVRRIWLAKDRISDSDETKELYAFVEAQIPETIELYPDCRITVGTGFVGEGGTLDVLDIGRAGEQLTETDVIDGIAPAGLAEVTQKISRELDETNPAGLLARIKRQLDPEDAGSLLAKLHRSFDDINAITTDIRRQVSPEERASVLAKVHETMDNLNRLTESFRREFDRQDEQSMIVRVYLAFDSLNASLTEVREMLEESRPKIEGTIAHVQATAKRLDEDISAPIARELDREEADTLLAKLHASLSSARESMDNIKTLSQTGKELAVLNRETLQAMIDDFAETASHLKSTAKEVRRNPWRLLYTPDKPEREYANLMETARAFADAAGAMEESNRKLKELLKLHPDGVPANDQQLMKIREKIMKTFGQFEQARQKLWKLLKLRS